MDKTSRRDAVRQYKERKVPVGIFALRSLSTGETFVGASRNLDGQRNSSLFSLRLGSHRNKTLQAAYNAAGGETGFEFVILEQLEDDDVGPIGRDTWLKTRERHWREELGASSAI
ncbi:MAG: hypothetical protein C0481_09720 [Phenylobacterium sp.]|uniref:GIY-YIG nuclease family protein n=1 Tax=Phenylobacterium sp. TaxID=1871053 RepID=UPI0025F72AE5|nr:GIY-YIG nuclease family protein [Phenylobacterium sp.]MBA4012129.1 hypothetical protein [Phenylobacterium sp.]